MIKINKLLSILLVFAMVLTILPLSVEAAVGSYTASVGSKSIYVGNTTNLTIRCTKAGGKFTVSSSDTSVATVSPSTTWVDNANMDDIIVVKGVSKGTATITITPVDVSDTEYNLLTGSKTITITVKEKESSNNNNNNNNQNTNNNKKEENKKSSDATLKSIELKEGKIDFNKNTTSYEVTVGEKVNSLGLKATPNDSKAKVEVKGDSDFKVGRNVVTIKVTAEDGTTKSYEIVVLKTSGTAITGNAPLLDLKVKGYELNRKFDPSHKSYSVSVVNKDFVEIEYVLAKDTSKVDITGDKNLKEGINLVEVKVTEEDGTVTTYTIEVNNTKYVENNNIMWFIIICILAALVIIEGAYIIIKRK